MSSLRLPIIVEVHIHVGQQLYVSICLCLSPSTNDFVIEGYIRRERLLCILFIFQNDIF